MFDILFGWRKASKCKELIRMVQCRLKLLKNKRCCIVKQLRHDIAQLLKRGDDQTAFQRVEQLFRDESMVKVYDFLGNFCEFIVLSLPHICKHKDLQDDINEAISSLIFSSAKIGDLPELVSLRILFGQRYGQRFVTSALELSPGNLVNDQIIESLCIKSVPDDEKYRLLNEIARSCVEPEYKPYFEEQEATKSPILSRDVQTTNLNRALEVPISDETEADGKIVYVDPASESAKSSKDHHNGPKKEQISSPGEGEKPAECTEEINKFPVSRDYGGIISIAEDSSSEKTSIRSPQKMIYLDDIEKFMSPVRKNGDFLVFKFPLKEKHDTNISSNEKSASRSSRKMRKSSRKRLRRRSVISHCQKQKGNKNLVEKSQKSFGDDSMPSTDNDKSHSDNNVYKSEQPRHIHPKLPDYDELVAKFMALKSEKCSKQTVMITTMPCLDVYV